MMMPYENYIHTHTYTYAAFNCRPFALDLLLSLSPLGGGSCNSGEPRNSGKLYAPL